MSNIKKNKLVGVKSTYVLTYKPNKYDPPIERNFVDKARFIFEVTRLRDIGIDVRTYVKYVQLHAIDV